MRPLKLSPHMAAAALGIGITLSPDNWVRLGNAIGPWGWGGLIVLLAGTVFYFFFAPALSFLENSPVSRPSATALLPMTLAGYAAILIPTGILVSSGFVFNEVFVYWFPNFGFAFLLLGIILGLHLWGESRAKNGQILFVLITLAAFFTLIGWGILSSPPEGKAAIPLTFPGAGSLSLLILWVGFDLARLGEKRKEKAGGGTAVKTAAALAGGIFFFWALASLFHTPLEKLVGSTIPHMKTARYIIGDTGRYLMGVVVIFGTLSCVNGLFLAARYLMEEDLIKRYFAPNFPAAASVSGWQPGFWARKPALAPLVLALAVGLMMAGGIAGSETLEIWNQALILAWLVSYALAGLKSPFLWMKLVGLPVFATPVLWGLAQPSHRGLRLAVTGLILGTALLPGIFIKLRQSKIYSRSLK